MSYKHNPKESTVLTGLQERSKVYIFLPSLSIYSKVAHLNKAHIFAQNLLFSAVWLVTFCKGVGIKCGTIQSGTSLILFTHCATCVEALRKKPLAKKYSTMERLCMWPISGSELVDVTYLIT